MDNPQLAAELELPVAPTPARPNLLVTPTLTYGAVTPARDEEENLARLAEALMEQKHALHHRTHPDCLVDERIFRAYARFLDHFAGDPSAWKALPREVSSWWRRRAATSLERDEQTWLIVGPAAAEARIELSELTR